MLAIKYILAACADDASALVPQLLPVLVTALHDEDDDVRATAADACVPVADVIAAQGDEVVSQLTALLWTLIPKLGELSPATASILQLLARLFAPDHPENARAATPRDPTNASPSGAPAQAHAPAACGVDEMTVRTDRAAADGAERPVAEGHANRDGACGGGMGAAGAGAGAIGMHAVKNEEGGNRAAFGSADAAEGPDLPAGADGPGKLDDGGVCSVAKSEVVSDGAAASVGGERNGGSAPASGAAESSGRPCSDAQGSGTTTRAAARTPEALQQLQVLSAHHTRP